MHTLLSSQKDQCFDERRNCIHRWRHSQYRSLVCIWPPLRRLRSSGQVQVHHSAWRSRNGLKGCPRTQSLENMTMYARYNKDLKESRMMIYRIHTYLWKPLPSIRTTIQVLGKRISSLSNSLTYSYLLSQYRKIPNTNLTYFELAIGRTDQTLVAFFTDLSIWCDRCEYFISKQQSIFRSQRGTFKNVCVHNDTPHWLMHTWYF